MTRVIAGSPPGPIVAAAAASSAITSTSTKSTPEDLAEVGRHVVRSAMSSAPSVAAPAVRSTVGFILLGLAGFSALFALVVALSAAGGGDFMISASGVQGGIPLPTTWPFAGLFVGLAVGLYGASRGWDHAGFVGLRRRHRWIAPTFIGVVVFPGLLVALFALLQ